MRRALRPAAGPAATQQQQQRAPADSTAAGSAEGADGSAEGFAGQLHASLELVLLSADRRRRSAARVADRGAWSCSGASTWAGSTGCCLAPGSPRTAVTATLGRPAPSEYQSLRPLPLKYLR